MIRESKSGVSTLSADVVIATRNRPAPLLGCLQSLSSQILRPQKVIIIDSSDGDASAVMIEQSRAELRFSIDYEHTISQSAARQRNLGSAKSTAEVIVFLDDDVIAETSFLSELISAFESDESGRIGGVSGTISNQVYSDPHGLNRLLLGSCLGQWTGTYAGKLLGPAVNFLPADGHHAIQEVEWLPSTCTAYRQEVFASYGFCDDFDGYSFAEDVHLSSRVHKTHRLFNTTRARVFHHDLGKSTHKDWKVLGESQVVNRHAIMAGILHRNRLRDHMQLFGYEVIYTSLAWIAAGAAPTRLAILVKLLHGKLLGFVKIWRKGSPHRDQPKKTVDMHEIV